MLNRRTALLINYENANRNWDKAKAHKRDEVLSFLLFLATLSWHFSSLWQLRMTVSASAHSWLWIRILTCFCVISVPFGTAFSSSIISVRSTLTWLNVFAYNDTSRTIWKDFPFLEHHFPLFFPMTQRDGKRFFSAEKCRFEFFLFFFRFRLRSLLSSLTPWLKKKKKASINHVFFVCWAVHS